MESKPVRGIKFTEWLLPDGSRHREDGPAIEWYDGMKEWWINGYAHRLYGPSVICANGATDWYINGECVTNGILSWASEIGIDLDNLTEDDKILIQIRWN